MYYTHFHNRTSALSATTQRYLSVFHNGSGFDDEDLGWYYCCCDDRISRIIVLDLQIFSLKLGPQITTRSEVIMGRIVILKITLKMPLPTNILEEQRIRFSVPLHHYGTCSTMRYMNMMDVASCIILSVKIVPSCNWDFWRL